MMHRSAQGSLQTMPDADSAAGRGRKAASLFSAARLVRAVFCLCTVVFLLTIPLEKVQAESVRIVIDPGHGGENLGAQPPGYLEKNLNLAVAEAMAEELRKYEGVEVFMTRTSDVELSLQQRADYAKAVGADFLFCLHFNMSEEHRLYGTEVWISAFGKCYAEGKSFGELCLRELCTLDLYNRGVKTRLNDEGTDYYGIIKHSQEYGIPSAIIEHCHLDNVEDEGRYETAAALKQLGVLDATAAAKYFGLYSPSLGADYRKYEKPNVEVPTHVMKPDETPPENASLTCLRTKAETGELNVLLTGEDAESGMLYYDYSLDGGKTYSGMQRWETDENVIELTLEVPVDEDISLKFRVYNGYNLDTETETLEIPALQGKKEEAAEDKKIPLQTDAPAQDGEEASVEASGSAAQIDMSRYERQSAESGRTDYSDVVQLLWLVILGLLVAVLTLLMITRHASQNKRKKAGRRDRGR